MFKNSLKNFLVNLKFFFVPLLTLALGFGIGLGIFRLSSNKVLSQTADQLEQQQFNVEAMKQSLEDSFRALDWKQPTQAIGNVLNKDWLVATTYTAVSASLGEQVDPQYNLPQLAQETSDGLAKGLAWFVVFTLLGILGGYYLTGFLVRRRIAKRALWKILLAYVLHSLVDIAMVALGVWLAKLWTYSIIFTVLLAVIITGMLALVVAYLLQGWHKVEFREIVNVKNAMQHWASVAVIWAIVIAVVLVLHFVYGLAAIIVGVVLATLARAVTNLNAEAYVKMRVGE